MRCERCGHQNPDENYFCGHCGISLLHRLDLPLEAVATSRARGAAQELEWSTTDNVTGPGFSSAPSQGLPAQPLEAAAETPTDESSNGRGKEPHEQTFAQVEDLPPQFPEPPAETPRGASVSGPSFLGLASSTADDRSLEYLYDTEPPRSYKRLIAALLLLGAFGAFIAYQWRQLPSWYTTIIKPRIGTAQSAQVPAPSNQPASDVTNASTPSSGLQSGQLQPPNSPAETIAADSGGNKETESHENAAAANSKPDPESKSQEAGSSAGQPEVGRSTANSGKARAHAQPPAPDGGPQPDTDEVSAAEMKTPQHPVAHSRSKREDASVEPTDERADTKAPGEALLTKGQAYLYGNGVPRSCGQALVYLRKAADMGNAHARSQLGALYATGHCVPLDRARAYDWFSLAAGASGGHDVWIERNREILWNEMTATERAQAQRKMY